MCHGPIMLCRALPHRRLKMYRCVVTFKIVFFVSIARMFCLCVRLPVLLSAIMAEEWLQIIQRLSTYHCPSGTHRLYARTDICQPCTSGKRVSGSTNGCQNTS